MNGRDLTLGTLAGLAVAGMVAQRRRGSRDAASEQGADYFRPGTSHHDFSVQQSGNGVVSNRFPSWANVRRRLQRGCLISPGEFVESDWDAFMGYAFDFTDPIHIWRAVTADSVEALRLPRPALLSPAARRRERQLAKADAEGEGVGIWWSWDPHAAEPHYGSSTHARGFLLAGEVAYDDVNWTATFYGNLSFPEEREIQVKPGAPVRLLRVRDDDTGVVEKQNLWVRA